MSEIYKHPKDTGFKLLQGHPLYWMEEVIEKELGYVSDRHNDEHEAMMEHFGIKFRNVSPLNGPLQSNGLYSNRREFHCLLHLRFWKDKGLHEGYVKKAEDCGYNLNEIDLPKVLKND
jgi:hypothetical protein